MLNYIKFIIKKYCYYYLLREKFSCNTQISQLQLAMQYQEAKKNKCLPKFSSTGFRVFSQFEEDGKIFYLFQILDFCNKTFVDIGSNDGINSNCANLAVNHNWHGLFIDADAKAIAIGKKFYSKIAKNWGLQPVFKKEFITPENINSILKKAGFDGEIDLLSIDIDGNDYWIWKNLTCIEPKVVIIESQLAFGNQNLITPYIDAINNASKDNFYYGASTKALVDLAKSKNYRLVGSNDYGNNLFFVKNGFEDTLIPEVDFETTLQHEFAKEKFLSPEELKKIQFIEK